MSDKMAPEMERENIEMLLPWFITGKLEAAEQAEVEAYLAAHPDMRKQLDLIEAERTDTAVNNEAMGAPSADALAKLMGAIEGQSLARRSGFAGLASLVQNGLDWLGSRQALVPVAAAAAVAIVLQAGTIGALLLNRPAKGPVSQTASAPKVEQAGSFAIVGFAPNATIHQVEQFLTPLGITIADGPKGKVYTLRLSEKVLSDAERDLLITALTSNSTVIQFAAPKGP
jgi:anti-sigma factor RsiW